MLGKFRDSYVEFQSVAGVQSRFGPLIGMVGYPLFYVIWVFILPQPYNSIWASATAFIGSAALFLSNIWPRWLSRWLVAARYLTTIYNIPFFFTYMLLMNGSSPTWQLSCMGGFIYLLLLSDRLNAVVMGGIGISAAVAVYFWISATPVLDTHFAVTLIAIVFVMVGYGLLARRDSVAHNEKLRGAALMASAIAHEVRTPLAGIRLDTEQCLRLLPLLLDAHGWAVRHGWRTDHATARTGEIPTALRRVLQHARSADAVVNMVLVSAQSSAELAERTSISIGGVVESAVVAYPMREDQRPLVSVTIGSDFATLGSEILIRHVIFNLLKNALRSIDRRGGGDVSVKVWRDGPLGRISVHDTGTGIPETEQPFVFKPFYTRQTSGQGAGIGLAFCKVVIETMGGTIDCTSIYGKGAAFDVSLPVRDSAGTPVHAATSSTAG